MQETRGFGRLNHRKLAIMKRLKILYTLVSDKNVFIVHIYHTWAKRAEESPADTSLQVPVSRVDAYRRRDPSFRRPQH